MKTLIIAEAGVNHNGSEEMAHQLIDVAVAAEADVVKFQTFKTEMVMSRFAPKAEYQLETTDGTESQFDMAKKLELDEAAHLRLLEHCRTRGIQFLSTPFDIPSVSTLAVTLDLTRLKIPSGEVTNGPLLYAAASTGKPIILSTGMCTLGEIEEALGVLAFGYLQPSGVLPSREEFRAAYRSATGQEVLKRNVVLMHCTTEYPAEFCDVNLNAMDAIRHAFGLPVGLSDHTPGVAVAVAAVARGATIIEKHFTLDKGLPGPDHRASLDPEELLLLVRSIRQVETAFGHGLKIPADGERVNMPIARKSLIAARNIMAGEQFTVENLTVKRPGTGTSPMYYWEWLGTCAARNYREDEVIQ